MHNSEALKKGFKRCWKGPRTTINKTKAEMFFGDFAPDLCTARENMSPKRLEGINKTLLQYIWKKRAWETKNTHFR